jgi:hypothetical protein
MVSGGKSTGGDASDATPICITRRIHLHRKKMMVYGCANDSDSVQLTYHLQRRSDIASPL